MFMITNLEHISITINKEEGAEYYMQQLLHFFFIISHYMAINYVEDNESASFYPPYIEKQVVYPALYKEKNNN